MLNDNERLQVEPVPVFNAEETDLKAYLKNVFFYCVELHNDIKDFGFNDQEARTFFQYMVRNSSEPQYRLIRQIKFAEALIEEKGGNLSDISGHDVAEVFSMIEELKSYINKLKQTTYKDFRIRAIAEAYYMDGLSIKEIVEILISLKVLSRENEEMDDLTDSHFKKVSRFVQDFKKHDVIQSDKK